MKKLLIAILLASISYAHAQQHVLSGKLLNKNGEALVYATTVLLNPSDSTLSYYGISNSEGVFYIKNIKTGNYIFQCGHIGYQSYFKQLSIPLEGGSDMGAILMKEKQQTLDEVVVAADRIPLLIKKDTVEYIADAFKTKPDASAEELLKRMPGVEVDRAGNIKAQGEDVQRVLVDGKEFFSKDPTVATKNLPADAIDKVQVYNKKSDETELTGIEDGSYSKTINMILKEGKKSAYFGDASFGYGNDDRYQGGAKLYRFTRKYQLAALGMLNNVNKFGFSFQDYLDFKGGLQSLMSGSGGSAHITLDDDSGLPINFGQPINGLLTSGAVGLNFTVESRKNNRFNVSYMGNGSDKHLIENTSTQNFSTENDFSKESDLDQKTKNRKHSFNLGWRNRIDSTQNLNIFADAGLNTGENEKVSFSESFENDILMNNLSSQSYSEANNFSASASSSYMKTGKGSLKLFKINASGSYRRNLSESEWQNITNFFDSPGQFIENRFQDDETSVKNFSAYTTLTFKIGRLYYLVPSLSVGLEDENLERSLSEINTTALIDSLSPDFNRQSKYIRAGLSLKRNTKKTQISLTARIQNMELKNELNFTSIEKKNKWYFLPRFSWQHEFNTGKRLSVSYSTSINSPNAGQLLPVNNTTNPLVLYKGNRFLNPEYSHNVHLSWLYFDAFSSTNIFANANASYTKDKINFSRNIYDNLVQEIGLVNVDEDYRASATINFSTPIRKLGVNIKLRFNESWNRGISYVNQVENINNNFSHSLSLQFDNRKKKKWDVLFGGEIDFSHSKYSIQNSLNKEYLNLSAFIDLSFTPNDKWHFSFSADYTRYDDRSFGETVDIPLLRSEINYYFLKNKRAVLSLEVFDLLDKNKGLERISEMNYLLEKQSNVMGRYALLSLKYRINKFDKKGGITINMGKRR